MARGLFLAVEELKEAEKKAAVKDSQVMESTAESAETEIIETNKDETELDQDLDTLDTASDDIDSLNDVTKVIENSAEGDGMSEDTAKMAEVAVESIMRRQGMSMTYNPIPSMESFARTSSRMSATKLSLEGIKETAGNLWKRFIDFINNIGEKIKDFFKRITEGVLPKLKTRCEQLKNALANAETIQTDIPAKGKSFAKHLRYNGELTPEKINEGIKNVHDFTYKLSSVIVNFTGISTIKIEPNSDDGTIRTAVAVHKKQIDNLGKILGWEEENGYNYSPLFSGDKKLCFGAVKSDLPISEKISEFFSNNKNAFKGFITKEYDSIKWKAPETIKVPEKKELESTLNDVERIIETLIIVKKDFDKVEKSLSFMRTIADKFKRPIGKDDDRTNMARGVDNASLVTRMVYKSVISYISSSISKFNSVGISTSKAYMDYVQSALVVKKD